MNGWFFSGNVGIRCSVYGQVETRWMSNFGMTKRIIETSSQKQEVAESGSFFRFGKLFYFSNFPPWCDLKQPTLKEQQTNCDLFWFALDFFSWSINMFIFYPDVSHHFFGICFFTMVFPPTPIFGFVKLASWRILKAEISGFEVGRDLTLGNFFDGRLWWLFEHPCGCFRK